MHTYNNVRDRLVKIVCEQTGLDYGSKGEHFRKLAEDNSTPLSVFYQEAGTDSLDEIEILMEIEDVYETEIPDEAAERIFSPKHTLLECITQFSEWLNTNNAKVPA